jgi:hypothetical protein
METSVLLLLILFFLFLWYLRQCSCRHGDCPQCGEDDEGLTHEASNPPAATSSQPAPAPEQATCHIDVGKLCAEVYETKPPVKRSFDEQIEERQFVMEDRMRQAVERRNNWHAGQWKRYFEDIMDEDESKVWWEVYK